MMKKKLLTILTGFFLFLLLFMGTAQAGNTVTLTLEGTYQYEKAYQVLESTNKIRRELNLPPLKMDQNLLEAAMLRAAEIQLIFSHGRPDGSDCFTACAGMEGENIAAGQSSAAAVVNDWKHSSGHYANMVNPRFTTIGIGCFTQGGATYWVQCFGSGQAKTPASSVSLRKVSVSVAVDQEIAARSLTVRSSAGSSLNKGKAAQVYLGFEAHEFHPVFGSFETFTPAALAAKGFSFTSSNPSVLSVSESGKLKALSAGTAVISVKNSQVPDFHEKISIRVTDAYSRKVKFQANGGSMSRTSSEKTSSVTVTYNKKYGTLPAPVRKGYSFKGWYTKKSGGSKITASTKVKIKKGKTQILYAHWSKVTAGKPKLSKPSSKRSGTASLKWNKVSGAKGYQVFCSSNKQFKTSSTQKISCPSGRRSATFTGLSGSKYYYFKVRSYKLDSLGRRVYGKFSSVQKLRIKG